MIGRVWKVGVAAGLVAIALGGASLASASGGGGGHRVVHSFKVFDHTVSSTNVDVDGSNSFTIGDEFIFTDQLWNLGHTKRIGLLHGVCTFVGGATAHCVETAHLHGGTLEGSGDINNSQSRFSQALTGGTGRFIGDNGQFEIRQLNQNDAIVTVEIVD
jgi:hypothetical protein